MQGIYKRYRTDKKEKIDKGLPNSQESGYSLVENAEPMAEIIPSPPTSDSSDSESGGDPEENPEGNPEGNPPRER